MSVFPVDATQRNAYIQLMETPQGTTGETTMNAAEIIAAEIEWHETAAAAARGDKFRAKSLERLAVAKALGAFAATQPADATYYDVARKFVAAGNSAQWIDPMTSERDVLGFLADARAKLAAKLAAE